VKKPERFTPPTYVLSIILMTVAKISFEVRTVLQQGKGIEC
jgi:hypothetical protein